MARLRDARVLITGAASGIGRLLAERVAAEGGRLVLWDRDGAALEEVERDLSRHGARVTSYVCDLSSRAAIYAAAERVLGELGPVDVLVNNAGVVTGKPLLQAADQEIERTFAVNTLAHFWTVRAFLPAMVERDAGHIVTVASAAGLAGAPKLADYSASKFAAVGFDESLRLELKQQGLGIKTTVVCPFYVNTGMFAGVRTRFGALLPILEPEYVVDRILRAVRRDRPRLLMPRFIHVALVLRALPVSWFDWLLAFFGVTRSMDEFTGRPAAGGRG